MWHMGAALQTAVVSSWLALIGGSMEHANQPSPQCGIAARYPNDLGLEKDTDVILFEGYELADVEDLRNRGWDWNRGHVGVWGLTDEPAHVFAGKKSLSQHMIKGREGSIMPRDLKLPEDGPVYHRVWIDGKEVLTRTQAFFRSTDRVHIRSVLDQARLDSHLHFKTGGHVWVDNLVVARQYIGPMTQNARP